MEDEIDLRAYFAVVVKHWKIIAAMAIIAAAGMFIHSKSQKPIYEAKASVLLKGSGGGTLSQFAGLAGMAGINLGGGGGGIADIPEMLKSYDLAEIAAEKISFEAKVRELDPKIEFKTQRDMVEALQGTIQVKPPAGNLLEIKAVNGDKWLAAEIANGYVEALKAYYNRMNDTEARKKREYIEKELPRIEAELRKAEESLKKFTMLSPQRSSSPAFDNLGINLGSNLGSSGGSFTSATGGGGKGQGIEVNRLDRELTLKSSIYMMLRSELESVKLEEAKEVEPFMVLDRAKIPSSPIGQKINQRTLLGLIIGLFGGTFLAFIIEYGKKYFGDRQTALANNGF